MYCKYSIDCCGQAVVDECLSPCGDSYSHYSCTVHPPISGSTALYTFLKEHPLISANRNNKDHYEEVQFFSNETLYNYGVEW